MSVRVSGFKFAALSERMRRNIADECNSAAESCVELARQLAPVSPSGSNGNPRGYMRDHIKQTKVATVSNLSATVESEADYSVFVEFGTTHWWGDISAQPFFIPAHESARRQLNNGLKRVLQFGGPRSV